MDILHNIVIPCICSFISCAAVGIQFNIRKWHLPAAALGSTVSKLICILMEHNGMSHALCCFIAAAAVSAYSEAMARFFKAPVNMYLVVGILPLVPGGLTYYTMLALVSGEHDVFIERGAAAFAAAGSIAMGIFAVSSVFKLAIDFCRQHKIS